MAARSGKKPLVELVLGEVAEVGAAVAEPVQQGHGCGNAGADGPGGGGAGQATAVLAAGAVDEEPVRVRLDQAGMAGWPGSQELVEPGRDPLEMLVAGGQDAGADQDVADVVHGLGWRQGVQVLVGERPVEVQEPGQQGGGVPVGQPAQDSDGVTGPRQRPAEPCDLLAAGAVSGGISQRGEPVVQRAAGAAAVAEQGPGRPAAATAVVQGEPGARPADQLARAGPGDQGLGGAAGVAGGGVRADVAVAGGADGADRPYGLDRALFRAAAAGTQRPRNAAGADRLAGGVAAGPGAGADRAFGDRAAVAGRAQVRAAQGRRAFSRAGPGRSLRRAAVGPR